MGKKIDLTGRVYGRLTVLSEISERRNKQIYWLCVCECGYTKQIIGNDLKMGKTHSCGCLRMKYTTNERELYNTWYQMLQRCYNTVSTNYKYYGAKGITVCDRWITSLSNFVLDMGERPNGYTLDRINNDGDYEPDNCRWVDMKTQCNNRSSNHILTYNNTSKTISEWSDELFDGRKYIITNRLLRGWSIDKTLTTKVAK